MQNSILQIDNAQVEIRNKLLNYKIAMQKLMLVIIHCKNRKKSSKKNKLSMQKRKLKNLDNAKKKIRKNFQRNMNI